MAWVTWFANTVMRPSETARVQQEKRSERRTLTMPKVDKTMKIDPEVLERIAKLQKLAGPYEVITFPVIARNGIERELKDLEKRYGKEDRK
jgi:hypothetical protein